MLYMKEMRANVVAECTLKESAAINQILGRRVGEISQASPCTARTDPGLCVTAVDLRQIPRRSQFKLWL